MNALFHIKPWRENGVWKFDDEDKGLKGEPFVTDANILIDKLVEVFNVVNKKGPINLLFGMHPFPRAVELKRAESEEEGVGVIYRWEKEELDAWLCPAFFCYYDPKDIPRQLYVMAAD